MAHARGYPCKSGVFWYVVPDDRRGRPIPCGKGAKGRQLATRAAARSNELKYQQQAGIEMPRECVWTLEDLHLADVQAAKDRGLRTALPQLQGKASRRESHWRQLLAFFGPYTNLEEITQQRIKDYQEARRRGKAGPVPINRDLWGVLRPAFALARDTDESGYSGDPFLKLRKLDERQGRREPIALSRKEVETLIRQCWTTDALLGAFVELLYLTGSRLNQQSALDGRFLRYPAHKGGLPRTFALAGRLAKVAGLPRAFDRKRWRTAVTAFKRPDLRPHDLRHSRLTHEGSRPGASLLDVQRLGGWKSPAMAGVYLHTGREALRVRL